MRKYIRKITKPIHVFYKHSPHVEHTGFVALAATEVFHLSPIFLYVNILLLVSGGMAVLYESFHLFESIE